MQTTNRGMQNNLHPSRRLVAPRLLLSRFLLADIHDAREPCLQACKIHRRLHDRLLRQVLRTLHAILPINPDQLASCYSSCGRIGLPHRQRTAERHAQLSGSCFSLARAVQGLTPVLIQWLSDLSSSPATSQTICMSRNKYEHNSRHTVPLVGHLPTETL